MLPTYYLSKESKKHVDTVLSGEGADEIFAGYGRYRSELLAKKYKSSPKIILFMLKILLNTLKNIVPTKSISHSALRDNIDRAINKLSLISIDDDLRFIKHFQPFYSSERRQLLDKDYFSDSDLVYLSRMQTNYDYFNKRYNLDITTWLPDQMLVKADRMSMAHSLEMRVPFLDHELVEFSATIPAQLKFSYSVSKIIVRNAAKRYFPKSISNRPKHGLGVPIDDMFRKSLKNKMFSIIEDGKNKSRFINHDYVKRLVDDHVNEKINNGQKILSVTSLYSWLSNN